MVLANYSYIIIFINFHFVEVFLKIVHFSVVIISIFALILNFLRYVNVAPVFNAKYYRFIAFQQ